MQDAVETRDEIVGSPKLLYLQKKTHKNMLE